MRLIYFLLALLLVSGCVTNKKYLYLQSEDELKRDFPTDTVLRKYALPEFSYLLQPEDVLHIEFLSLTPEEYDVFSKFMDNNQMNMGGGVQGGAAALQGYLIDPLGNIEFPAAGKVNVAGLSIYKAEEKLEEIAADYLEEPVLKLRLLNFRFTVLGEVNGAATLTTFNNRITLPEALGYAGGVGELADRSEVKVIRQRGAEASVHYVNLLDENLLLSEFYYVHPNDIIVVPPLRQRPFRQYFGPNLSLFISTLSTLLLIINLTN